MGFDEGGRRETEEGKEVTGGNEERKDELWLTQKGGSTEVEVTRRDTGVSGDGEQGEGEGEDTIENEKGEGEVEKEED